MLKKLDMVAVRVADFDKTLVWYRDSLGLGVRHVEQHDLFAILAPEEGDCVLTLVGEHPVTLGTDNRVVPSFHCPDVDAMLARCRERGVEVISTQDDEKEGYRLAVIRDCEGNFLQFYDFTD